MRVTSFKAVMGMDCRVLILGSMPGVESLRKNEYYGHPRNAFWTLLGELYGFDPALPYIKRLGALVANGVGLWDVAGSCERKGSLDSDIRDVVPNDITGLLKRHPSICLIVCNGGTAWRMLRRFHPSIPEEVRVVQLPSTSPAHAARSYAGKLQLWREALSCTLDKASEPRYI